MLATLPLGVATLPVLGHEDPDNDSANRGENVPDHHIAALREASALRQSLHMMQVAS